MLTSPPEIPNTTNLTIQCDTTKKKLQIQKIHIFFLMGTHPKKMAFLPKYTWG
jgi:hypothetical protein